MQQEAGKNHPWCGANNKYAKQKTQINKNTILKTTNGPNGTAGSKVKPSIVQKLVLKLDKAHKHLDASSQRIEG